MQGVEQEQAQVVVLCFLMAIRQGVVEHWAEVGEAVHLPEPVVWLWPQCPKPLEQEQPVVDLVYALEPVEVMQPAVHEVQQRYPEDWD